MLTSYTIPPMADLDRAFGHAWSTFPNVRLEREDVRAEFLELVCRRASGKSGAPYDPARGELGAWLYALARTAIHHAIQYRSAQCRGTPLFGLVEDAALVDVPSEGGGIIDVIENEEMRAALDEAMSSLTPAEQSVLRKMDSRRPVELQDALGVLRSLLKE